MVMGTSTTWHRVTRRAPCPICGRPDWCAIGTSDGGARTIAKCMRVSGPIDGARYLITREDGSGVYSIYRIMGDVAIPPHADRDDPTPTIDAAAVHQRCVGRGPVGELATSLGVSVASLTQLGVGYATADTLDRYRTTGAGAWTFPMRDARGRIIGIRLRMMDGVKKAITGSRNGLFVPEPRDDLRGRPAPLFLPEGPTSTAALLTMGLDAIGRPMARGMSGLLHEYCRDRHVIVLGDGDAAKIMRDGRMLFPGQEGAIAVAHDLAEWGGCMSVRAMVPPLRKNDARDLLRQLGPAAARRALIEFAGKFREVTP